ncbi:MAG: hypothetical protein ACK2T3_09080 [Candidatus Promineifilaceae bacterium]|jgi:cellobiose-specific phosphotransferase system component IIA
MKLHWMKRYHLVLILFAAVFVLAGCEKVSDARSDFCDALDEVGETATEFKNAKVDEPVEKFQSKVDNLRDRKERLDKLAKLTDVPALDRLANAIDNVAEAVSNVSGNTLGPAVDKVQAAGAELKAAHQELDDAVCAEK